MIVALCGCDARDPDPSTALTVSEQVELGRALFLRSRIDSAAVVLEEAHAAAVRAGDPAAEADALTWWAYTLWQAGELEEAEQRAYSALELMRRHSLPDAWRAHNVLGLVAWWASRNTEAVSHYREALGAAGGDPEAEATVGANLALVLFEFGDFEGARAGFEAMRAYGEQTGERRLEGNALINLAMLDVAVGDPAAAVAWLERARTLHESIGSLTGVEFAIGHLGTAYAAMGEIGRAYATLDTALMMTREYDMRPEEAENLSQLANLHADAEDTRRALDLYAEARAINEDLGFEDRVASDLRQEAVLLARLERYGTARASAERAFEIHDRVGARLEAERDLLTLAELAQLEGERLPAEDYLSRSRATAEAVDAPVARAEAELTAARIADAREEPELVLAILEQARDDMLGGDYTTEWESASLEAKALLALGRVEEAEEAGRRAVDVIERVRGGLASGVLRTSLASGRLATYGTLVQALLLGGRDEEGFAVADEARAPAVTTASATRTTTGDEGERILRRIESLMESLEPYLNDPSPEARAAAEDLGRRVIQARDEYELYLIRTAERSGARRSELGAPERLLADVQSTLGADEVLVEYFVAPERLTTFAVTREGFRAEQRPISSQSVASRVRLARELLSTPGDERSSRVLEDLYELLVRPLAESGLLDGARRLVVVPHDALTYLPVAALRDHATGRYLVEQYELLEAPSASGFVDVRRRAQPLRATGESVAFAPFPDGLPASRVEARAVAEALGGRAAIGSGATEQAFRRALTGARIVHAATHGVMNPLNPMFSRVELAARSGADPSADGRLEVHELLTLSIGAELVFLSGCETGVGSTWSTDFAQGEDYATLARAFLLAGAENVVASLWRLEDPAAAEFARLFYARLEGTSPAEALAGAQRAMLRDERYRSPSYWAPYQVLGAG